MGAKKSPYFDMRLRRSYNRPNTKKGAIPVTVCIAALCNNDSTLVCVSDRMLSVEDTQEFETRRSKILEPTTKTCIMIAGDTDTHMWIYKRVFENMYQSAQSKKSKKSSMPSVQDVALAYAKHYEELKTERARQAILAPLGLDFKTFIGKQSTMDASLVAGIADGLANFRLPGVAAIIAGFDGHPLGGHIYSVLGEEVNRHSFTGFISYGTGASHATSQFMLAGHYGHAPFYETLLLAYCAKKRSEVAPGVGKETDILIHHSGKKQKRIPDDSPLFSMLDNAYAEIMENERKTKQKVEAKFAGEIEKAFKGGLLEDEFKSP